MKYHFIGIKGSGMSALAQIMFDLGNEVQGSDVTNHLFTQDVLEEKNIKMLPFDSKNITNDMIIVRGGAFRDDHPEVIEAKRIGAPMYTYFELLGNLTAQYETIAVCGDHGKTTTTALATHVFKDLVGTNYLIGDGTGYASRDNQYFIIEACEHKRHFLHYFPKYIIMTNIEWDHVDYYKDLDDIKEAYQTFCEKAEKQIIACGDDNNIRSITIDKPILYYGFNDNNDVIAKNVEYLGNGSSFDVYMKDDYLGNYFTPLQGKHMVLNATAVLALAHLIGLDLDKVKDLFKTFKGARRRFVEKKVGDNILIDDYAHHPTEVRVTIEAARQKYPDKEIIAVFKPNNYSRTKALYKDFIEALKIADKAYVTDIFCDREKQEEWPGVTSNLIIDGLDNGELISEETVDKLLNHHNSVILFMSCKDVYVIQEAYEKLLEGNN